MRPAAFVFSLIVLAAGVLLGIVYPRTMENAPGREIGRWTVYAGGDDFQVPEMTLQPSDGPTLVTVTAYANAPLRVAEEREVLLLSVLDGAGDQVHRAVLGFPEPAALESPQSGILRSTQSVGMPEAADGPHRFVFGKGRDFADSILTVEVAVNAARYRVDPNARPVGIALMVVGGLGLAFSLRRRRENPNSSPPPPKWGRR